jgi:large subunit ribosomal protein L25
MDAITLAVERRTETGKNEARRVRRAGKVPGIVYGAGKPSVPVVVDRKALIDAFRGGARENAIYLLKMAGTDQTRHAMIKLLQRDPVSLEMLHVDFIRVLMDTRVRVRVPLELTGTAYGVKSEDGILDFVTREVEIECLPGDIPSAIQVDVSELHMNQSLRVSEIARSEAYRVVEDAERVVAHVGHPRREEEVAPAEGAVAAAPEAPAEPEVIKKGKVATEEDAEKEE